MTATSQFISPFDTLPNILYTNPTNDPRTPEQFTKRPFDTLPNPSLLDKNPTISGGTASPKPRVDITNPTFKAPGQFKKPFDILPNIILASADSIPALPISAPSQFIDYFEPTVNWIPDTTKNNFDITNYTKDTDGYIDTNSSAIWSPNQPENTNTSIETIGARAAAFSLSSAGGFTGIPYVTQLGQSFFGVFGEDKLSGEYITLAQNQLKRVPGVLYADFRSRLGIQNESDKDSQAALSYVVSKRLDGTAAAIRKGWRGAVYAGASVSPLGPYSIFNLETLYGWGEHDNPNAIRADFTLRSHISTAWRTSANRQIKADTRDKSIKGEFIPTRNPQELATPFRGDKISVIDFSKRTIDAAYDWKRKYLNGEKGFGKFLNNVEDIADLTQDFIKFYFTGPKLYAGNVDDEDDIIVFRAIITSFSETFNPGWTDQKMIGRADPNYIYTGLTRDLTIDFDIYATDRDELKPIYRKLNALAGYTAPTYDLKSIAMQAPWMRLTIGDLYYQTPVIMNSLGFTYDMDASWEINIEDDPTMMQVPRKISVSAGFNVITDYLPQKGGRFWTLAKTFENGSAVPKAGNDNWLSDTLGNIDETEVIESKPGGEGKKRRNRQL